MTARTSRRTVDPEAREAEMEALHDQLTLAVDALVDSAAWTRYLDALASFHRYSWRNVLLIAIQRPDATKVAGYQAWRKLGRQVRKGEKSIRIMGGRTVAIEDESDPDNGKSFVRYFPTSVFAYEQTDAIEGADDVLALTHRLDAADDAQVYERTAAWLTAQGWDVAREPMPGQLDGYTVHETRRVRIDASLSPADAAATILHEAAHAILHEDTTDYVAHRGQAEVEAESVAYVVGRLLGMDTSPSSVGYIAGWSKGDREVIAASVTAVQDATHRLAEALVPEETAAEDVA